MTNYIYYPDELYHHGIKGMRWGVRRTPEELGRMGVTKTANKLRRRENKINRMRKRSAKLNLKSAKYNDKALRTRSERKAIKFDKKSSKYNLKSARTDYRIEKKFSRGQKIAKRTIEKYRDVPIESFDQQDYSYVQNWIEGSFRRR